MSFIYLCLSFSMPNSFLNMINPINKHKINVYLDSIFDTKLFRMTHWCELPNMGSHIFTKGIFYNPIKIVRVGIAPYENQTYPFKNQEEAKRVRQKIEKACESEAIKFDPDEAQKGNAILREIFCNF